MLFGVEIASLHYSSDKELLFISSQVYARSTISTKTFCRSSIVLHLKLVSLVNRLQRFAKIEIINFFQSGNLTEPSTGYLRISLARINPGILLAIY